MTSKHAEMHRDHQHWRSDNSMWQDDLELWEKEVDQAMNALKRLENALGKHRAMLQDRLDLIAAEDQAIGQHEHTLAEFERSGTGEQLDLLTMAKNHKKAIDRHARQLLAHERLKKRHHMLMANWSLLFKALTERT
jgi:hypothetical protein